jgi:hypothetical protein
VEAGYSYARDAGRRIYTLWEAFAVVESSQLREVNEAHSHIELG